MKQFIISLTFLLLLIWSIFLIDYLTPNKNPINTREELYYRCVSTALTNKWDIDNCNKINNY